MVMKQNNKLWLTRSAAMGERMVASGMAVAEE